ncbi:MAG: ABC transporter substrate-binding protein [Firmicutes bacterium]|nr:ABC transporter substrate-binding protein [Bacillota bacterium]
MLKKVIAILIVLIGVAGAVFWANRSAPPPNIAQSLTIALDWTPNINHSGLYVAQALGYFTEQGLTVNIVEPGETLSLQLVAAGQAEFGFSYQEEATFARARGVPVVSLAAVIQHNTSCFASPAAKGIKTVADFAGKIYGGWGGAVEEGLIEYLMEREGLPGSVQSVVIGEADFFAACDSYVDFSWIYYGVTGIEANLREYPLNIIMLKDLDAVFDIYTPIITAEEKWLQGNEDTTKRFLKALAKGYRYADANPEETAEILLKAVDGLDAPLLRAGQAWIAGKYQGDAAYWGWQDESVWQGFADWLANCGMLQPDFNASEAFSNDFLPQK